MSIAAVRPIRKTVTADSITHPTLRQGSRGPAVADLQRRLNARGAHLAVDGDFGPKTEAAVKAFQRAHGLAADGVVGPHTWGVLDRGHATGGTGSTGGSGGGSGGGGSGGILKGADTSHWQSTSTFEQSIKGAQWSAIKATEGTGFTDASFASRWKELGQKIQKGQMKLRVAYHFLSPGNGTAQAKHFLSTLGIHGKLQPGTRLALDWEASALRDPKALRDAANYIHQVTGTWPLVYCSASQVGRAKAAVPNAPIWEAKWSGPAPKNVPFVQTSDGPGYDHDQFNGSLKDLEKFAGWR